MLPRNWQRVQDIPGKGRMQQNTIPIITYAYVARRTAHTPKILQIMAKNNENPYNDIFVYCPDKGTYPKILPIITENKETIYVGICSKSSQ